MKRFFFDACKRRQDIAAHTVRSGLCCVARYVVQVSHMAAVKKGHTLIDLLGFRAGSVKACAEVSGWTRLCEVELPKAIGGLISTLRKTLLHNDDKKKRQVLKDVQTEAEALISACGKEGGPDIVDEFFQTREAVMPHGSVSLSPNNRVQTKAEKEEKKFDINTENGEVCRYGCTENKLIKWCARCNDREKLKRKEELQQNRNARMNERNCDEKTTIESQEVLKNGLNVNGDTDLGIGSLDELSTFIKTLTIHDVIYEHVYAEGTSFTESMGFGKTQLLDNAPNIKKWLVHVMGLPKIRQTSLQCGYDVSSMEGCLKGEGLQFPTEFSIPPVTLDVEEDNPEIGRGEYRLSPASILVVAMFTWTGQLCPSRPVPNVLPEKRVSRKCEQLENLATAVQSLAKPGDVIVDFCSGACNLDYFQGSFDIGVCLHACGVATDLVLQQCLERGANFVICPCCYGSIHNTHLITYPRSQLFREAGISDYDLIVLGHAGDQTEKATELYDQGV
ncbi:GSTCD-like protein [Mya arenaria]|uniref:GSTCD-like protein n=1 Tax=Mya arenaria TaxID=6604 RepID=A0ABY7DR04_MYAAR|nr:GSTCD-like protein [Mya arenaria]